MRNNGRAFLPADRLLLERLQEENHFYQIEGFSEFLFKEAQRHRIVIESEQ
jgi:hypothetical protein